MKDFPLVTVITCTYNSTFFLEETVESIANQTYPNIEYILVDDCSTNGTQDRIIQLQKKHGFSVKFLEKNSGACPRPLNEGIKMAKGKYITFCAHDDYFLPEKIERQVAFLEQNPEYMMAFSKAYNIFPGREDEPEKIKMLPCQSGHIFSDLLLQRFYIPGLTNIFRKEIFDTVGGVDENLVVEDWDMWLRIANIAPIGFVDEYLACYHYHEHNTSKLYAKRTIEDRKTIIEKWRHTPYYSAAISINRLIEGESIQASFFTLLYDTWRALFSLKQPHRVLRLFLSNLRRHYFTTS